jgi:intracellular septation protein A
MKNLITYASQINWSKALLISITAILVFGTFTALWKNPFFIRMLPITILDFLILGIESLLLGLYLSVKKNHVQ